MPQQTICGEVLSIVPVPGGGDAVTIYDPDGDPRKLKVFGPDISPADMAKLVEAKDNGKDACVSWSPANPGVPTGVVVQP
jgi:hypothetical protein